MPKKTSKVEASIQKPEARSGKAKSLYRREAPKPVASAVPSRNKSREDTRHYNDIPHAHLIATAPFTLREDGSIQVGRVTPCAPSQMDETAAGSGVPALPKLVYQSDTPFVRLYHGNSLDLLDAIFERYGEAGRFDAIFADPPYFLSNGGITCHAGKMVKTEGTEEIRVTQRDARGLVR